MNLHVLYAQGELVLNRLLEWYNELVCLQVYQLSVQRGCAIREAQAGPSEASHYAMIRARINKLK